MDHRVEQQDDMEVLIEVVDEQFYCVLLVDCLICLNQLILEEVCEFFVVSLGVNLRKIGSL